MCKDISRERYSEDKDIARMKLEHEMRLSEMKLKERDSRRLNELELEEEREKRKLRLMELEERRQRDERADRLKEHELNLTMQNIESRNLDSTLTSLSCNNWSRLPTRRRCAVTLETEPKNFSKDGTTCQKINGNSGDQYAE